MTASLKGDRWRTRGSRRQRWAEQETARRQAAYSRALTAWQLDDHELTQMIAAARSFEGLPDAGGSSIVSKRNERVFFQVPDASLVEVQRSPGRYTGGYSGFSFRITRGVRYHVGGSRGTYVQGAEQLKVTDGGSVTITSQRVVFTGTRNSREWSFSKLVSVEHDQTRPVTMIGVSSRQKISGLIYPVEAVAGLRFNLALAIEDARDNRAGFVASLEKEQAAHRSARPVEPMPARPEDGPAGGAILGALKTIYTGKPTCKPRSRILTGLAASLLTVAVVGGIAGAGNSGKQTPTAHSSTVTATVATPSATPSSSRSVAAARALARRQAREQQAAERRRELARRRAQERRRQLARQRAQERRRQQQAAAQRARARASARAEVSASAAAAAATHAPVVHSCTTTSSGSCIQGGEFCPQASYGQYGWDADGTRYECTGDSVHPHWEGPL